MSRSIESGEVSHRVMESVRCDTIPVCDLRLASC